MLKLLASIFSLCVLIGCAVAPASRTADLVPLAERFMASYAQDLSRGDREALARRYHPQGVYVLGNGSKSFESYEATRAFYRDHWKAPSTFEWKELSYEPVGNTGVLVLGTFRWGEVPGAEPRTYSYSGLLVLVDGELRIRAEDESSAAAAPALPIASGQYTFQHRFTEQPTIPSLTLSATITGTHIVLTNPSASGPFPAGVLAEGELMWHAGASQWIIGHEDADRTAQDVGGCSDGPEVIDLVGKTYWTC